VSKFSYKSLLIIFSLLLIGVVILWKFILPKQKVSAAWWNDSWHYRQAIDISSHTTAESNVYITTSINIGSTAKAQTDDGDFRFIDNNGNLLDYYLVSGVGTTSITFHILIPSFPAGTSTIYAYYGNSTIENGFSSADFSTQASNYTIGSLSSEEVGGGPIAYWKFDEGIGTTAYDSANNQNNGTISGATWSDESQCVSGKCLDFNGTSNFIKINQSPTFNYLKEFTISFWIKHDGTNSDNYIFYKGSGGPYAVNITGNTISFNYWNTSGTRTNGIASVTVSPNQWHQITITFKENDIAKSYIDGKLANSTVISSSIATNTTDLYFNTYNGTNNNTYNVKGVFDEVKIYPYARTADQIKQDYNSRGTLSGSSANLGIQSSTAPDLNSSLFSHWKFDNSLFNSTSTGSTAIAPLSGTANYTSTGKNKQGLDFTQLYTGNFTYVSGNTFQDSTKNWTTNELVGYQFATDYTPNSQYCQGTITSNTSTTITFSGSCSSWSGNKYYRIKKSIYISAPLTGHSTNAITASLWFKSNTSQGNRIARMSNEAFHFTINGNNISTGINTYGGHITYTTTNANDQKWHYMAITYDGSTEKLYYDGIAVGLYSTATTVISNGSLTLGSRNDGMQEFFNGSIDEVKVYNRALTADEIKQDYNQGSAISFGSTNQTIGGTTTSLDYCIPGDTSYCAPPVAEWKMDEGIGTSITDTSGNSNTGTIYGATWTQGKIGSALKYSTTNDYVYMSSLNNKFSGSGTVSMWVKWTGSGFDYLFDHNEHNFLAFTDVNGIRFFPNYGADSNDSLIISNISWDQNWHQITFVANDTTNLLQIYFDGILKGSSSPDWSAATVNNFTIGAISSYRSSYNFQGSIDNVKIYNYARTPAQIAYDYNKGAPIGWWKFDECQGNTVYDWSGIGNTGSINIGPNGTQNFLGTCSVGTSAAWTNGATGKINSSLNFDGSDDYINLGTSSPAFLSTPTKSVTAWIKVTGGQNTWRAVISHAISGFFHFQIQTSNKLEVYFYGPGKNATSNTLFNSANYNKWFHIVGVWNGTYAIIYINGIEENRSTAGSGAVLAATSNVYIGDGYQLSRHFPGQIDDVRIYNYALTSEQIKQLYNGGAVNFN